MQMIRTLSVIILLAIAAGNGISETTAKIDFKTINTDSEYTLTPPIASIEKNSPWDGRSALRIDTRNSVAEWNRGLKTKKGLLLPGKEYRITFRCKNLYAGEDSFAFFLIRRENASNSSADICALPFSYNQVEKILTLDFYVPEGINDYTFQIFARKKMLTWIDNIIIAEKSGKLQMPANGSSPPIAERIMKLPSGSEDFTIDLPRPGNQNVVSVTQFGARPDGSYDCTKAFNDAIDYCRQNRVSQLVAPVGEYHFTGTGPLAFKNLSDLEFDGQGSRFVFYKTSGALFMIDGCERVLLKNFSVDWDWGKDPLGSVVKVEQVDSKGKYVDLRFIDYDAFPKRDVALTYMEQIDPVTRIPGFNGSVGHVSWWTQMPKGGKWLSPNLLRLNRADPEVKPGMVFRLLHYRSPSDGFLMHNNIHLTISNVNIFSCPGVGFKVNGEQHHWQMLNTNIARPAGSKRPVTATADGMHIARSQGYFKMENCEFSSTGDDCLNVHDITIFVTKNSSGALESKRGHTEKVGDVVELRNDDYSPSGFIGKVKSISPSPSRKGYFELRFDLPVPDPRDTGFVLFNRRYGTKNIIIRNNYFHENRGRGILLLAQDVTVENNRFYHNPMGAIRIETGYTLNAWSEGYGAGNIIIRNNTIDTVNSQRAYGNEMMPAIYMSAYLKTDPSCEKTRYPILNNVLITNNRFVNCPGAIAYVCSAEKVFIKDNRIITEPDGGTKLPFGGVIGIAYSSSVLITGNQWQNYVIKPVVRVDAETTKDIYSWNNRFD